MAFLKKYELFFLGLIVFLSRLPFLNAGYGHEEDSWGIALAAHNTFFTGIYEVSRLPGHPVQELILSVLWGSGPFVYNLLSTIFSCIAVVYFAKCMQILSFRYYWLAGLTFAFVPVVYIAGTYTVDYMWSEAFAMLSFYFLLQKKYLYSGFFLGISVGCRITSGAMLIPFAIMLFERNHTHEFYKNVLKLSITSVIVGIFCFIPVYAVNGKEFFMYYDQFPYPPLAKVIYKGVIGVWGSIGVIALLLALVFILQNKAVPGNFLYSHPVPIRYLIAAGSMIVLFVISYLRLPQKSAYIIPLIPFVIMLISPFLQKKQFFIVCALLIASPFVFSINLTDKNRGAEYSALAIKTTVAGQEIFLDVLNGPIFSDFSKRKLKMKYTDKVIEKASSMQTPTAIICGWWYNEIKVKMLDKEKNKKVIYEDYCDVEEMNTYIRKGYKLYFLPEQDMNNDLMYTIQETGKKAVLFEIEEIGNKIKK